MEGDQQDLFKKEKIGRWFRTAWNDVKSFFREVPAALVFVACLVGTSWVFYQPATLIDHGWSRFEVFQRSLLWFIRGTVVRSLLGGLVVLAFCSFVYWLKVRKHRFIVVSEFRVWGSLTDDFPAPGVAARLRDELMRLLDAMRSPDQAELLSQTGAASSADAELLPRLPEDEGLSLPETHVTLQYQGISLEVMGTFVRRTSGREVVITGDLMGTSSGLTLAARASDLGPWEVVVGKPPPETLPLGLQRLAIRIMTTMTKTFQPYSARTYALLQIKAREAQDYEEAFRLAKLGRAVAADVETANWNLATAHHDIGVELANDKKYWEAIKDFEEATKLNPDFLEAHEHLGHAYGIVREEQKAAEAFKRAKEIRERELPAGP